MPAPTLVILAAGASRRYGRPKQLDPLGPEGETIMELTARDAVTAGVDRIVLVLGSGPEGSEIAAAVEARMRAAARRDGYRGAVRIDAVHQRLDDLPPGHTPPPGRTRPWGTAHAVRAARPLLGGTGASIVVANADDWYGPDAIARIVRWAAESRPRGAAAMVPYPLSVVLPPASAAAGGVSRGLVRADADDRLVDLAEHVHLRRDPDDPTTAIGRAPDGSRVRLPLDRLCSMNLWAFDPAIWYVLEHRFPRFPEALATSPGAARRPAPVPSGDAPSAGASSVDAPSGDASSDAAPSVSAREHEWLLPDVVLAAVRAGELDVRLLAPGTIHLGVTHPEDRARVRDALTSLAARG